MSMNRVSSLETYTTIPVGGARTRSASEASTRARKLSFNPLPEEWNPPTTTDQPLAVGAFEVPKWKRLLQVIAGVLYCMLAAGVVFGFAAIKPVLKAEGAYRRLCAVPDDAPSDGNTCVEMHLNLMFTVAAVATNVAALPVGAILDHYGPRVCSIIGSLFLAAGALLMAWESIMPFDALFLGYQFLALGGPFTYISSFHLSNAFPRHSGFILALLTGAFDASSALFLVYRVAWQATNGAFNQARFFSLYVFVPAGIILLQFILMPPQSYKTAGELIEALREPLEAIEEIDARPVEADSELAAFLHEETFQEQVDVIEGIQNVLGPAKARPDEQLERETHINDISGVWGVMHGLPAREQFKSFWFVLICLFTVVQMTRINFFLTTIRAQYAHLLPSPADTAAAALNAFFDVALPAGGLLAIPFIGLVLDRTSTPAVLAVLVVAAAAMGVLGLVAGRAWAAYANVVLFALYRPFYYTAVSDFCAKVFGFATFGIVYGAVICCAGVMNLGQAGLDWVFERACQGDPTVVNAMLLLWGLGTGMLLVGYVEVQGNRGARGRGRGPVGRWVMRGYGTV